MSLSLTPGLTPIFTSLPNDQVGISFNEVGSLKRAVVPVRRINDMHALSPGAALIFFNRDGHQEVFECLAEVYTRVCGVFPKQDKAKKNTEKESLEDLSSRVTQRMTTLANLFKSTHLQAAPAFKNDALWKENYYASLVQIFLDSNCTCSDVHKSKRDGSLIPYTLVRTPENVFIHSKQVIDESGSVKVVKTGFELNKMKPIARAQSKKGNSLAPISMETEVSALTQLMIARDKGADMSSVLLPWHIRKKKTVNGTKPVVFLRNLQ